MVTRLSKRKDWKAEYVSRIAENGERLIAEKTSVAMSVQKDSIVNTDIASNFIVEILGQGFDVADRALQKMMCRHNLENLEPPADALPWNTSWGSKILCEICLLPAINDSTICQKCNAITHNRCILDAGCVVSNYECPSCLESVMVETDYYEYMLHRLEHEKRIERDARKIAKRLVVVVERKRLAKKRRAAVLVQSAVRRFIARNKYLRWLRAQMKPVTVKLLHIPVALMEHGVVVLTVYDMLKGTQSFRLDATVESAMKQGFLIPGLAANLTLLLTIARKEEFSDGRRQYIMLGQAQLSLRDIQEFTKKGRFDVNFMDKIKYPPIESKGEFKYHLVSFAASALASGGIPSNIAFSSGASLAGSTTSSLPYLTGSVKGGNSAGGPPQGLSAGSLFSTAGSLGNTTANYSMLGGGSLGPGGNQSVLTASAASTSTANINPLARSLFMNDRLCSILYYPQNPVINLAAMCNGPPLDILKRASDVGMKKAKTGAGTGNYRNSRYWLCLYRLKLVFFQYYGDILPRLVADVSEATAVLIQDNKGRKTPLVNVVHADQRVWLLEFDSRKEACKFEFALNESRKACSEGGSRYALKSEITAPDGQFDFNVATIY